MKGDYYYPASAMRVCVDRLAGVQIGGRAYCPQLEEPILFEDLALLLLLADQALDRRGYPLAFQKKRSLLADCIGEETVLIQKTGKFPRQHKQVVDVSAMRGELCTFLVHVLSRRNSGWQGRIDWIDDGGFDTFGSDLVFLRKASAHLMRLSPGGGRNPEYY